MRLRKTTLKSSVKFKIIFTAFFLSLKISQTPKVMKVDNFKISQIVVFMYNVFDLQNDISRLKLSKLT